MLWKARINVATSQNRNSFWSKLVREIIYRHGACFEGVLAITSLCCKLLNFSAVNKFESGGCIRHQRLVNAFDFFFFLDPDIRHRPIWLIFIDIRHPQMAKSLRDWWSTTSVHFSVSPFESVSIGSEYSRLFQSRPLTGAICALSSSWSSNSSITSVLLSHRTQGSFIGLGSDFHQLVVD